MYNPITAGRLASMRQRKGTFFITVKYPFSFLSVAVSFSELSSCSFSNLTRLSFCFLSSVIESSSSLGFLGTGFIVAPSNEHWKKGNLEQKCYCNDIWIRVYFWDILYLYLLTPRQKLATILLHHCHPKAPSRAVTTGAKTMVPKPEPHVEIPKTKTILTIVIRGGLK